MNKFIILLVFSLSVIILPHNVNATSITGGYFFDFPNKTGLPEGQEATSNNFTNIQGGVGSVVIEFEGDLTEPFSARSGNENAVNTWSTLNIESVDITKNKATIDFSPVTNGWVEIAYQTDYLYFGNVVGDANFDGSLSPIDALLIINYLNDPSTNTDSADYDIDNSGTVSPIDALIIINILNSTSPDYPRLANGPFDPSSNNQPQHSFFPIDLTLFELYQPSGNYIVVGNSTVFDPNHNDIALISESGQLALAMVPEGEVPVPEPTTMLLVGSGILVLVGFGRKFRKG